MEKHFTVQTKGLGKEFDGRAVLNRIDIHIAEGEIYGILGENGVGKTTLLKLIAGLLIFMELFTKVNKMEAL